MSLLFEFELNLGLETNFDQFCLKWDRYCALVLFSSSFTVTRPCIFLDPFQMLSDSSKNSRRIVIRTARSSANHSNQVSLSFSILRIKPLIKWTSAITWNQCQIGKLSNDLKANHNKSVKHYLLFWLIATWGNCQKTIKILKDNFQTEIITHSPWHGLLVQLGGFFSFWHSMMNFD